MSSDYADGAGYGRLSRDAQTCHQEERRLDALHANLKGAAYNLYNAAEAALDAHTNPATLVPVRAALQELFGYTGDAQTAYSTDVAVWEFLGLALEVVVYARAGDRPDSLCSRWRAVKKIHFLLCIRYPDEMRMVVKQYERLCAHMTPYLH